jgi:hypothetical protein
MTKGELDKVDIKLLGKLAAEGPSFFSSASWEMRASEMRRHGFMSAEMACYSMTGGGRSMDFRNRYSLTDKGRAALPNCPATPEGSSK